MRPHPRTKTIAQASETGASREGPASSKRWLATAAAIAAGVGAAALLVGRQARAAERRNPPTGRFIEVDGVAMHYEDRGEGPPVVLIHGNGTLIQDWELSGLTERLLDQGHRVIALDRPGYGYSDRPRDRLWTGSAQAELVAAFLRELGLGQAVIVGHSWGTIVAVALALNHPDLVRGLVLLSGYYLPSRRADVWLMSPPALPVVGDVMRYTVSPILARLIAPRLIRKVFEPRPVPERFVVGFPLDLALRPSQLRASAADSGLMVPSVALLESRYHELQMPVAIMTGDGDRIVTARKQSIRLHREIAHSSLRVFPGIGHMLHYFAGREIARQVGRLSEGETERSHVGPSYRPELAAAAPAI